MPDEIRGKKVVRQERGLYVTEDGRKWFWVFDDEYKSEGHWEEYEQD